MEAESSVGTIAPAVAVEAMLLDCYMELIAYTGYLAEPAGESVPEDETAAGVYADLVERSKASARAAGFSEDRWLEGFFPVCAYIDETLMCSDWPGQAGWERRQLQRTYFNTTAAGWDFYDRLDGLEETAADLRTVYEFCLALGFKGRYFRAADSGTMTDIQHTQLKAVSDNVALAFPETLFPEAYEPDTAAKQRKRDKLKRLSVLVPAGIVLPLIVFTVLYMMFDRLLDQAVAHYLGVGF